MIMMTDFMSMQLEGETRQLLGSLLHTQNRLKGLLSLQEKFMNEGELANSKMYASMCQLKQQLDMAFNVLADELRKED